jgi:hypothetical protein
VHPTVYCRKAGFQLCVESNILDIVKNVHLSNTNSVLKIKTINKIMDVIKMLIQSWINKNIFNGFLFSNERFHFAGKMKGLAFIQDPDGYWIEILNPNKIATII